MLCRSDIATCFVQVINTQSVNWVSGSVFIAVVVVKKKKRKKMVKGYQGTNKLNPIQ